MPRLCRRNFREFRRKNREYSRFTPQWTPGGCTAFTIVYGVRLDDNGRITGQRQRSICWSTRAERRQLTVTLPAI